MHVSHASDAGSARPEPLEDAHQMTPIDCTDLDAFFKQYYSQFIRDNRPEILLFTVSLGIVCLSRQFLHEFILITYNKIGSLFLLHCFSVLRSEPC